MVVQQRVFPTGLPVSPANTNTFGSGPTAADIQFCSNTAVCSTIATSLDDAAVHALLHSHHAPIGRDVAPLEPEYFARPQSRENCHVQQNLPSVPI